MFDGVIINPKSLGALESFLENPTHALLIEGPEHIGKSLVAERMAGKLLGVLQEKLDNNPGLLRILPDNKGINVESIRNVGHFLSLKSTGGRSINRVVLILDADLMNVVAQNALLKMVEEPPSDTVILLTSSKPGKLLQTIKSRLQRITLQKPTPDQVKDFLSDRYDVRQIDELIFIHEGRIGSVITSLDIGDGESAFTVSEVKQILGLSLFERILLIEGRLKDRSNAEQFVDLLSRIASVSVQNAAIQNSPSMSQWHRIYSAAHTASGSLNKNGNVKITMTELMLALR